MIDGGDAKTPVLEYFKSIGMKQAHNVFTEETALEALIGSHKYLRERHRVLIKLLHKRSFRFCAKLFRWEV